MHTRSIVVAAAGFVSTTLLAQGSTAAHACVASEQALRAVAHRYWAAYNQRDAAVLDELLDDRLLHITESGNLLSKAQVVAPFRMPAITASLLAPRAGAPQAPPARDVE